MPTTNKGTKTGDYSAGTDYKWGVLDWKIKEKVVIWRIDQDHQLGVDSNRNKFIEKKIVKGKPFEFVENR